MKRVIPSIAYRPNFIPSKWAIVISIIPIINKEHENAKTRVASR
jgi:hypothetical protein